MSDGYIDSRRTYALSPTTVSIAVRHNPFLGNGIERRFNFLATHAYPPPSLGFTSPPPARLAVVAKGHLSLVAALAAGHQGAPLGRRGSGFRGLDRFSFVAEGELKAPETDRCS
jgi:hypothetical protein